MLFIWNELLPLSLVSFSLYSQSCQLASSLLVILWHSSIRSNIKKFFRMHQFSTDFFSLGPEVIISERPNYRYSCLNVIELCKGKWNIFLACSTSHTYTRIWQQWDKVWTEDEAESEREVITKLQSTESQSSDVRTKQVYV